MENFEPEGGMVIKWKYPQCWENRLVFLTGNEWALISKDSYARTKSSEFCEKYGCPRGYIYSTGLLKRMYIDGLFSVENRDSHDE